ncbi:hypothetical protein [Telmatospirillum siberiense]|uniref:Uncharacterized protein n=1 Tax=Telmatospirillum siberiense TaxID=382514 RepID=A0A2N3PRL7_9PROT|nr:hypothetical protein [Telmatospirillum siberiense]PKU23022.1 hypothetical protein CWS72_18465 [Telmatospirillum siberiense]
MRIIIASLVLGPLLLIGGTAADAGTSVFPIESAPVKIAARADSSADREGFVQRARERTAEWQQKLQILNDKAAANGSAAGTAAEEDLHKAWIKIEAASHRLEDASDEEWQDAKTAFETASHELADTWHRRYPADK